MRFALARCRSCCTGAKTRLRALLHNRRGQAGVITAILAPIIVGVAALAIDAALWQANQRSLQGAADPPTFTLFANREVPPTYLRYLERRLREEFDLGQTAVKMRVRRRTD